MLINIFIQLLLVISANSHSVRSPSDIEQNQLQIEERMIDKIIRQNLEDIYSLFLSSINIR